MIRRPPRSALFPCATLFRAAVRARAREGGARVEIQAELMREGAPPAVESVAASGERGHVWTRKQAGRPARCSVTVDGQRRALHGAAVVDEKARFPPRHTPRQRAARGGGTPTGGPGAGEVVEGVGAGEHTP